MSQTVELLMSGFVTHDTKRLVITKPKGFAFEPGQAVEIAIDQANWRGEKRPFTPTSCTQDRVLELTIKAYPKHRGVTAALHALEAGARLKLSDPFGSIKHRGPGVFIAAGTGITPFLAILRHLADEGALSGHRLLFSNKSEEDVICGEELRHYLGDRCIFTFTREHRAGTEGHRIDTAFLSAHMGDLEQYFYLCGPEKFIESVSQDLLTLGVHPDRLVYD